MDSRPQAATAFDSSSTAGKIAKAEAELRELQAQYQREAAAALKDLRARREDTSTKQSRLEEALEEMHWMQINGGVALHAKDKARRLNPKQPSAVRNCRLKGFLSQRLHKTRQEKILQRRY